MEKLIINADRRGYSTSSCGNTLTVGELISYLEDFPEDTKVFLSFDNGYTYGGITYSDFLESEEEDEETDEENQE